MNRQRPSIGRLRVKIAQAVALLGLEARTVRDMAQRGEVPGAAKPRGIWTFDLAALEQFQILPTARSSAAERRCHI
jgi:hypothetical protein